MTAMWYANEHGLCCMMQIHRNFLCIMHKFSPNNLSKTRIVHYIQVLILPRYLQGITTSIVQCPHTPTEVNTMRMCQTGEPPSWQQCMNSLCWLQVRIDYFLHINPVAILYGRKVCRFEKFSIRCTAGTFYLEVSVMNDYTQNSYIIVYLKYDFYH